MNPYIIYRWFNYMKIDMKQDGKTSNLDGRSIITMIVCCILINLFGILKLEIIVI